MRKLNKLRESQPEDLLEKSEKNFARFKEEMRSISESVSAAQKEFKDAQQRCHTHMKSISIILPGASQNDLELEENTRVISTENPAREEDISTSKQIPEPIRIQAWQRDLIFWPKLGKRCDRACPQADVCETVSKCNGMAAVFIASPTRHSTCAPLMGNLRSRPLSVSLFYLKSDWDSAFEFSPTSPTNLILY